MSQMAYVEARRVRYSVSMATNASGARRVRTKETIMAKTTTTTTSTRETTAEKVVKLRNEGLMSWAQIGAELGFAPRTARRLYQESQGEHSHHGLLPSKGGRLPKGYVTTDATALTAPGTAPWIPRTDAPEGIAGTKGSAVVVPAAPAPKAPRARKPKVAKA